MVTESRRRVLMAYRRFREQGYSPTVAIFAVHTDAVNRLHCAETEHEKAEAQWDKTYADRYYKIMLVKAVDLPYWGRVVMVP